MPQAQPHYVCVCTADSDTCDVTGTAYSVGTHILYYYRLHLQHTQPHTGIDWSFDQLLFSTRQSRDGDSISKRSLRLGLVDGAPVRHPWSIRRRALLDSLSARSR